MQRAVVIRDDAKKSFDDMVDLDKRWEIFFKNTVAKYGLVGAFYTRRTLGHQFLTYIVLKENPRTLFGYAIKMHPLAVVNGPFDLGEFYYAKARDGVEITIKDYTYEKEIRAIGKDLENWREYVYGKP
jgi:hypothetical protein